jgi:nucleotide-binding universal stress UspA family protein
MFERIVAAIDSDPERGAKVAAAAQELAQQSGSRALVVHVREVERPAAMVGMARPRALPPVLHVESEE